ncbi:MAG: ATP-binding protein, partial [Cyanobacteria bacterium J06626_18]
DSTLASDLDEASYQINNQDARLLASALADPFDRQSTSSYLLEKVAIPNDPVLQVPATAFIFHVPDAYWKIVLVKSNAAIVAPANQVTNWLLLYVLGATLVATPLGYWALKRWLINPIADMTEDVEVMAEKISVQDWQAISNTDINPQISNQQNEIGLRHRVFNTLAQTTADKSQQLQSKNLELSQSLAKLTIAQGQLVQAEKMSSLGQLVAGIAHEINNPVNFIHGNLAHAGEYTQNLMNLVEKMEAGASQEILKDMMAEMDLDFVKEDLPRLLASMETGTYRIREIVLSLRNFSRLDEAEVKTVDIHQGLDSTLTILGHRTKAHSSRPGIQIVKCYGDLPTVECYPGPLNQVFMNLLSNALDALEEKHIHSADEPSKIAIRTEVVKGDRVQIHIQDNGPGISPEVQQSVFKYLFTTKPAGKGTGLGLTISRDIVESKHEGRLSVFSNLGEGTTFTIELPIHLHSHQACPKNANAVVR